MSRAFSSLSDDFARSGLKPFHVPVGVMLDEKNPHKSRCIRCNTCDGFACLVGAKSDAQVVCIDEAIKHSNVTLLTNSLVKRLETDASGREVKSVVVERNGSRDELFRGCGCCLLWRDQLGRAAVALRQ